MASGCLLRESTRTCLGDKSYEWPRPLGQAAWEINHINDARPRPLGQAAMHDQWAFVGIVTLHNRLWVQGSSKGVMVDHFLKVNLAACSNHPSTCALVLHDFMKQWQAGSGLRMRLLWCFPENHVQLVHKIYYTPLLLHAKKLSHGGGGGGGRGRSWFERSDTVQIGGNFYCHGTLAKLHKVNVGIVHVV